MSGTVAVPFVPQRTGFIHLGLDRGVYRPDYQLKLWQNGDPRKPIHKSRKVDLSSVISIQTSKTLDDISGTFTVVMKDAKGVGQEIAEMDVASIAFSGHGGGMQTVLRGVIDSEIDSGAAGTTSAQEDGTLTGRCIGKYLQITNTFRPVWDPQTLLPTSLVFGWGASLPGIINLSSPRQIWGWLYRHFIVGQRNVVGESGIPNARFWLTYDAPRDTSGNRVGVSRWQDIPQLRFPYIQFDEADMGTALKQFEILGYTEAWVDELGRTVYRQPQWDAPYSYFIPTDILKGWSFASSDVDLQTYVEVTPTGAPGLDSAYSQATMTGRAPVPSTYATALHMKPSPGFTIPTDNQGKVTPEGLSNYWYRLQRKYGLRTLQITSPLIDTLAQAQAQAEGLLRFFSRLVKTATITIPGDPRIRIGTTCRIKGELRGRQIDRVYYINGVSHDYVEGDHFDTTLQLTHGRDPWDWRWREIALPSASVIRATSQPAVLNSAPVQGTPQGGGTPVAVSPVPANAPATLSGVQEFAVQIVSGNYPYVWGGGHNAAFGPSGGPPPGYDCSGFVCAVLAQGLGINNNRNPMSGPMTSGELMSYGDAGPGAWVTIYTNAQHVIMVINGTPFGSESPSSGGPQVLDASFTAPTTLDGIPCVARHPPGL